MNSRLLISILSVLIVLLAGISILLYGKNVRQSERISGLESRFEFSSDDRSYVEMAVASFAAKQSIGTRKVTDNYYATLIHIGTEVCVSLNIDRPGLGEPPVYCYDAATSTPTRKWDDVE